MSGFGEPRGCAAGAAAGAFLEALRTGERIAARAVAVVAHPDDETVGFGLRLARFDDLTLVHVTDGAPQDMGDAHRAGFSTPQAYAEARARELDAGLEALDASPRRVALRVQDQTAVERLAWLAGAMRPLLANAEMVLAHAYEGGHPDHDACAFAVQLACEALAREAGRAPVRLEFAEYHKGPSGELAFGFWSDPSAPEAAAETEPEAVARKAAALACHRSQGRIVDWFDPARERYRIAPRYDFAQPPPPGRAVYDDWGWPMTSGRWVLAARAALAELAVPA